MTHHNDRLVGLLEEWEALVRNLQQENVVLRAERDEARRALATLAGSAVAEQAVDNRQAAGSSPAPPTTPAAAPTLQPRGRRGRRGRVRNLTDADLDRVKALSVREAADVLDCAINTLQRARHARDGYAQKSCKACGATFQPSGPNARYCPKCGGRKTPTVAPPPAAPVLEQEIERRVRRIDGVDYETVWNGGGGLSSVGHNSSLSGLR
jgi:hypothetical protein